MTGCFQINQRFRFAAAMIVLELLMLRCAAAAEAIPGARESQELAQTGREVIEDKEEIERLRREWFEDQRTYPAFGIPRGAKLRAWKALRGRRLGRGTGGDATFLAQGAAAAGPWVNIGPAPQTNWNGLAYSNRVTYVAADPSNGNHWLASTPAGGLWETADAGVTWTPRSDDLPSLATGAVAFAPSNPSTIYSGIGEPAVGGFLKSTDGGATWQVLATSVFAAGDEFVSVRIDPTNAQVVYVGTYSFWGNSSNGVWKTENGGTSWTRTLAGRVRDLKSDPANINRQYALLGGGYPNAEDGVYRFNGTSWVLVAGPWGSLAGNEGGIAIAPTDANTVYVNISCKGVWKTSNAWASVPAWTSVPDPPRPFGPSSCPDFGPFVVDRANSAILWGGGVYFYKFDGTSWTDLTRTDQINGLHVDLRGINWAGSRLLLGNDGGVFSTVDGGTNWLTHNSNLSITQFYAGSLHPTNPAIAMGGSQDDGTASYSGAMQWDTETWGDGMANLFSTNNPDTRWATSSQGLKIYRTRDGGVSYSIVSDPINSGYRPFFGEFEKCPGNEDVVIAGSHVLWKSLDFFSATTPGWLPNGPDDTNDPITAMAFAPSDTTCGTYAYGHNDSRLRITTTGGGLTSGAWADLDPDGAVPNRVVTDLAFHPVDANTLYVTLSGYDENTPGKPGHIFKATDAIGNGFSTTTVALPSAAWAKNIRLRWRLATDYIVGGSGWHIDSISMSGGQFAQNFDSVVVPSLPAGWTTTTLSGTPNLWVTNATGSDSLPNHASAGNPPTDSDNVLVSPLITVPANGAQVTFRHYFQIEEGYDGGVLEISIDGGAFQDILAAGGSFVSGGYTGTISSCCVNPLAARSAWTGASQQTLAVSWQDISPPDSNVPFNSVVLDPADPSIIYVGTDLGIWRSFNGGSTWTHLGPEVGMPDTVVLDLHFNRTTNSLIAFTYGRGAFKLTTAAIDTDTDGVTDDRDNCSGIMNTTQRDTDGDGYGNRCDADLDNNGSTNFADLALFRQRFGTSDPHADLDGNGAVNFTDLAMFRALFGKPPGPSAFP